MEKLNILWINNDKIVATYFLEMYTINSMKNDWWDDIKVIIWSSSNNLIKEDKEVQCIIRDMIESGVKVEACKVCSDALGTSDLLRSLGVDVKNMGVHLTKYIKDGTKIITI